MFGNGFNNILHSIYFTITKLHKFDSKLGDIYHTIEIISIIYLIQLNEFRFISIHPLFSIFLSKRLITSLEVFKSLAIS